MVKSLNKDADFRIQNGTIVEQPPARRDEEWVAKVKLTPFVLQPVTAESAVVVGRWWSHWDRIDHLLICASSI